MAALFDGGTTKRAQFDITGVLSAGTAYTAMAWIKKTSNPDYANYMGVGVGGGSGPNMGISYRNVADPTVGLYVKAGTSGSGEAGYDTGLALGSWGLIGYTWDGGTAGVAGTANGWRGGVKQFTGTFTVGSVGDFFFGHANDHSLDGKLGPMYVWTGVLSDANLLAQASQAAPITSSGLVGYWPCLSDFTDSSGNGHTLTNNGSITFDAADNPTFGSPSSAAAFTLLY